MVRKGQDRKVKRCSGRNRKRLGESFGPAPSGAGPFCAAVSADKIAAMHSDTPSIDPGVMAFVRALLLAVFIYFGLLAVGGVCRVRDRGLGRLVRRDVALHPPTRRRRARSSRKPVGALSALPVLPGAGQREDELAREILAQRLVEPLASGRRSRVEGGAVAARRARPRRWGTAFIPL